MKAPPSLLGGRLQYIKGFFEPTHGHASLEFLRSGIGREKFAAVAAGGAVMMMRRK